jgi:hypothetical protein
MAYSKPKSPLQNKNEDYFYPLTTSDQIIVGDKRLPDYSIISNNDINMILFVSNWVEVNGRYEQTIEIENLTENYNVRAKLAYTDDYEKNLLINENAAYIKYAKQNDNKITFYCLDSQPQVDIPIELEVYL